MNFSLRVVLILLIMSISAGVTTGSTIYYRLGLFWIAILISSYLIARYSLRGIRLDRTARTFRSQVGQIFIERFEIVNLSWYPRIWIDVDDRSLLPGARGSHVISFLRGRDSRSYLSRTRLLMRGIYTLGPTVLKSGDLFGLFQESKNFPAQETLLVYPILFDIPVFPSPAGWLSGGEAIRRRTHQITTNASGVREYVPGDPINRIHWISTARRDRLIVKEFELDPMAEIWIFLDANKIVHCSEAYDLPTFEPREQWRPVVKVPLTPSTIEYSVSIAGSVSRYFLGYNRAVGLISKGRQLHILPSDRGPRQLGKILETLAILLGEGELPLEGLVETQVHNIPKSSTVILISPAVGKSIPLAVENLTKRGYKSIVILINAESFGGNSGIEQVSNELRQMNILNCVISKGDEMSHVIAQQLKLLDNS